MEKELFDLLESLDEHNLDNMGIHYSNEYYDEGTEHYRVYHQEGYCFDVRREYVCDPEDVEETRKHTMYLEDDGYTYEFFSLWDGFKKLSLKQAIELVKRDGVFIEKDK